MHVLTVILPGSKSSLFLRARSRADLWECKGADVCACVNEQVCVWAVLCVGIQEFVGERVVFSSLLWM